MEVVFSFSVLVGDVGLIMGEIIDLWEINRDLNEVENG